MARLSTGWYGRALAGRENALGKEHPSTVKDMELLLESTKNSNS